MTIDPAAIKKEGNIHVPQELLMSDVRDKTETRMVIQKIMTDIPLDDELFDPEQMKQKDAPPVM